ncbi:glycosyl transferase group 1 [Solidesulfovibrio carbinoliphilus subsp. oakridgensis]|uniref:Glycosyl transferase group 1 n=1 Tax=Solidesulfovibrio carbinoliphilus subsp. oakridgensis TaxID=694327 RepID=G7QDJ9_9BACT|nr:glycosyltransferase [Solidesulfovibrio carbinoliphilus]EHJ46505.1 glycosyl transferase group 1 [Solidesulfovibrio carbinoliphilus subsp. oakridgensis]
MPLTVAWYGFDDPAYACARLRVLEPANALGPAVRLLAGAVPHGPGHRVRTDILDAADLLLIQRYFPSPATAPVLEAVFASGKPVVYDTDDDWTAVPPDHPFAPRMAGILPHILETARRADCVTVSTTVLAAVFRPLNPRVRVVRNFLPDALWRPVPPPDRPVVAVGLAGTPSHGPDLAPLASALSGLAGTLGEHVRFVFFGCTPPAGTFPGATTLPFTPDYAAYAARLPRLGCGVGLAPLADTPFNRAKSPMKWMEYAAAGMAGVFADLPPYREVVEPGVTGLLAGPDPAAWHEAVSRLVCDAALRRRMAGRAMEAVAAGHLLSAGAREYLDAWTRVAAGEPL